MKSISNALMTKKIKSNYSGTLEITWLNGKKILNSENANYSYGAQEIVFDFGLRHAHGDRSAEILILGLGGGSVINLLRKKFNYYGKITAIEIDPAVIDIAIKEFQIKEHGKIKLVCEDAWEYVKKTPARFGLIIMDVFIDLEVPLPFYSAQFWKDVSRKLKERGTIVFNAGINSANQKEINQLVTEIQIEIEFKKLKIGTNTLLLGTKKGGFK